MLAAALAALAPGDDARAQPVTLRASSWAHAAHPLSLAQAAWCAQVAQATAGRVRCEPLARPVSAPPGTFDAVRDGLADLAFSVHAYSPGRFVGARLAELPFSGDSAEAASVAYQRVYARYLAALNEHRGLKVVAVFAHGPGQVLGARHAVASLADLAGMRLRVDGGTANEVARAIGAVPVMKPASELPELLSSNAIDGSLSTAESVASLRLNEAIRHRTSVPDGLYNTSFALVMNLSAWERIAARDQGAIERLSGEHAARLFGRAWDQADRRGLAMMQAAGVQATTAGGGFLDELRARTALLERAWVADASARGLVDPETVLREHRAEVARLR